MNALGLGKYYKDRYDKRSDVIEKRRKRAERKQEINEIIAMLQEKGYSYRDIGKVLGITKQRIEQIINGGGTA